MMMCLSKDEQKEAVFPQELIRMSVGLENPDDIIADLEMAFKQI